MNDNIEEKIHEMIVAELERQSGQNLKVTRGTEGKVEINGTVNLDDLALAITGALAGGP